MMKGGSKTTGRAADVVEAIGTALRAGDFSDANAQYDNLRHLCSATNAGWRIRKLRASLGREIDALRQEGRHQEAEVLAQNAQYRLRREGG